MENMGMVCAQDYTHTGVKLKEKEVEKKVPFEIDKTTTLTGIPIMEALTQLNAQLEETAYKPLKMADNFYLTDINAGYLIEELIRIFGPTGVGWRYDVDKDDFEITTGKFASKDGKPGRSFFAVTLNNLHFYYCLLVDGAMYEVGPIIETGGSRNSSKAYALKGALTNAIGNAASRIGWQIDVYKGLRTHNKDYESGGYTENESPPAISLLDAASLHLSLDREKDVASSDMALAPAIQYQLLMSLEHSQPASELGNMIGSKARKAVMGTIVALLELAKVDWDFTEEMMDKKAQDLTIGETCNLWTALVQIASGDKKEDVVAMFKGLNQEPDDIPF
jgi:hypothetical protein